MHQFLLDVYRTSGLAAIPSPWLATSLLHFVLAVYLFAVGTLLGRATLRTINRPRSRRLIWVGCMLLFGLGAVLSVVLHGFIELTHPDVQQHLGFTVYFYFLFLAVCTVFAVGGWRAAEWGRHGT